MNASNDLRNYLKKTYTQAELKKLAKNSNNINYKMPIKKIYQHFKKEIWLDLDRKEFCRAIYKRQTEAQFINKITKKYVAQIAGEIGEGITYVLHAESIPIFYC